ncbi:alpha-N-arabinofuranosidase [Luteimonas suaedae]|uniref:alpha-N-arabinofuranosidase n=1 Tax=Luteimonas suaedae TaxID=2605430 RepID=UPI0011EDDCFC|nr:alpha-N-arabinofuranosidase [Luteimonas suaedae]
MSLKRLLHAFSLAAVLAAFPAAAQPADAAEVRATLRADAPGDTVSRHIFGQFAEHLGSGIYGGIWVGEDSPIPNTRGYRNDVVEALRRLEVPVVRWPGGCFADEYHWREGIGPRDQRPVRVNTHWGGVEEPNTFGTHEFMDFAELIGTDAYVSGNVGNGTPEEMAAWVEYITSDTKSTLAEERRANGREQPWKLPFFGVGNELWGCGGNMRPEYAADLHRRYQTFVKAPHDQELVKVAAGANSDEYNWTEVMMREAGDHMDALSVHYYTVVGDWPPRGFSFEFEEDAWIETLSRALYMDELITRHSAIMDKYDPEKKVPMYVDEWGTWYAGLPGVNPGFLHQQNTLRDALVASLTIDIFSRHADRVKMANIAQMVNVLQAMILTDEDNMLLTPTYHAFELYRPFQDATHLPLEIQAPNYEHADYSVPAVHGSAVRGKDGHVYVALTNLDANRGAAVSVGLQGHDATRVSGRILTAPAIDSHNTFDQPETVEPADFDGARVDGGQLTVDLPAKSVVMLQLQ